MWVEDARKARCGWRRHRGENDNNTIINDYDENDKIATRWMNTRGWSASTWGGVHFLRVGAPSSTQSNNDNVNNNNNNDNIKNDNNNDDNVEAPSNIQSKVIKTFPFSG